MPRCGPAVGQVAVSDGTNGTPANRELDWRCRLESRSVHRGRCGRPARLGCVPAAGGAGYAGRRAGMTHPRRRTSPATAVMSAGMAGSGASVPTRSSRRASSPGGSRASSPASATSTMLPSTPPLRPEEAPPGGCRGMRCLLVAGWPPPGGTERRSAGREQGRGECVFEPIGVQAGGPALDVAQHAPDVGAGQGPDDLGRPGLTKVNGGTRYVSRAAQRAPGPAIRRRGWRLRPRASA